MRRRARVGVFTTMDQHGGGIYQYTLMVLNALERLRTDLDLVLVDGGPRRDRSQALVRSGWEVISSPHPMTVRRRLRRAVAKAFGERSTAQAGEAVRHVIGTVRGMRPAAHSAAPPAPPAEYGIFPARPDMGRWLRSRKIDLMLYPAPSPYSFASGVPYVMAVHDLQHRIHPEFPEVSAGDEWESREALFSNGIRHALAILVDSEVGREDVLEFYGDLIAPERIRILPFVPPPYLKRIPDDQTGPLLAAFGVSGTYLLFPAQFWPHKNHLRVAQAIADLHRDGLDVTVVMTGSASDPLREKTLADVRALVSEADIDHLVRILGYVDDATMAALYSAASGLILPTFFGPTNIPVIEAWSTRVPVLTSDIRGIREQCGDAAILVDPQSVDAIADGIRRLWTDEALRRQLVEAGARRLALLDASGFADGLADILRDALKEAQSLEHDRRSA